MLDLVIKNGKTIDHKSIEIGINSGKIVSLSRKIATPGRKEIYLSENQYISAGWIDDHVHCYEKMDLYYDYPDEIGVSKGVTTIIDAGTTGAGNISDFYQISKNLKTNIFALLNISNQGIIKQNELSDLSTINEEAVNHVISKYPQFIVGIKARMSKSVVGSNDIKPLQLAKKIQTKNNNLPLMVHIGSEPPKLSEILSYLDKGDILTHCFNGKSNGILNQLTKSIKKCAWDAYEKGIIFDIGHGTDSFNFEVAEIAMKEGLKANSISTDIYIRNRLNGPVFDLSTTMEKLRAIGYSWEEIIEKVTKTPADNFQLKNKGYLLEGFDADMTIFEFVNKKKILVDSNGVRRTTNQQIQPIKTIIGGKVYDN